MNRTVREELYGQAAELSAIAGLLIEAAASRDFAMLERALDGLDKADRVLSSVLVRDRKTRPYASRSRGPDYAREWEKLWRESARRRDEAFGRRPPPPHGSGVGSQNAADVRRLLEIAGLDLADTQKQLAEIFRAAQRKAHPDAGGSAELFKEATKIGIRLGVCNKQGKPAAS